MATELDLDDVAAQSPKAQAELAALCKDSARHVWLLKNFAYFHGDKTLGRFQAEAHKAGIKGGLSGAIDAALAGDPRVLVLHNAEAKRRPR